MSMAVSFAVLVSALVLTIFVYLFPSINANGFWFGPERDHIPPPPSNSSFVEHAVAAGIVTSASKRTVLQQLGLWRPRGLLPGIRRAGTKHAGQSPALTFAVYGETETNAKKSFQKYIQQIVEEEGGSNSGEIAGRRIAAYYGPLMETKKLARGTGVEQALWQTAEQIERKRAENTFLGVQAANPLGVFAQMFSMFAKDDFQLEAVFGGRTEDPCSKANLDFESLRDWYFKHYDFDDQNKLFMSASLTFMAGMAGDSFRGVLAGAMLKAARSGPEEDDGRWLEDVFTTVGYSTSIRGGAISPRECMTPGEDQGLDDTTPPGPGPEV